MAHPMVTGLVSWFERWFGAHGAPYELVKHGYRVRRAHRYPPVIESTINKLFLQICLHLLTQNFAIRGTRELFGEINLLRHFVRGEVFGGEG